MTVLFSSVVAALAALALPRLTLAVPLAEQLTSLSLGARDVLKRTVPAAPHFVVYDDIYVSPLPSAAKDLKGFNTYILSFWMLSGAGDMALTWQQLTDSQRKSYITEYNDAGISLMVSAFGETDAPTSSGANPVTVANNLASWVRRYELQGVDIDYEDFTAFNSGSGTAEQWLISLTQELRKHLPQGEYTVTHAPVAPWWSPGKWSGGGYLEVDKKVGYLIDWYHIQFYNQGTAEYTTCNGLLNASTSQWPKTALYQIITNGVDRNKLVIGKPGIASDADNGYVSPQKLASCVAQAHSSGWNAGVMAWEYPDATSSWITTVRGNTWPL